MSMKYKQNVEHVIRIQLPKQLTNSDFLCDCDENGDLPEELLLSGGAEFIRIIKLGLKHLGDRIYESVPSENISVPDDATYSIDNQSIIIRWRSKS